MIFMTIIIGLLLCLHAFGIILLNMKADVRIFSLVSVIQRLLFDLFCPVLMFVID